MNTLEEVQKTRSSSLNISETKREEFERNLSIVLQMIFRIESFMPYNIINENYLIEDAEIEFYKQLMKVKVEINILILKNEYLSILNLLTTLIPYANRFLDEVIINSKDLEIKANRKALLRNFEELCKTVGDLSKLQIKR